MFLHNFNVHGLFQIYNYYVNQGKTVHCLVCHFPTNATYVLESPRPPTCMSLRVQLLHSGPSL